MLFDTHCHTYLSKQKSENDVLQNIKNQKNLFITNVWVDLESSKHSIEIAEKYDFAYASVWIHPCDIWKIHNLDEAIKKLENLAKNERVVAVWECWLDYYRLKKELTNFTNVIPVKTGIYSKEKQVKSTQGTKYLKSNYQKDNLISSNELIDPWSSQGWQLIEQKKKLQKQFFIAQIELARKLDLPVIIHNREAKDDILNILKETDFKNFIMHCFSENLDFANACLDFSPNAMISFSWILTFNSTKEIQETASKIPLKNILIETDSPYLTPTPFRWQENYPSYVQYVFEKLCSLRTESKEEIEKQVWENSLEIFKIKTDN